MVTELLAQLAPVSLDVFPLIPTNFPFSNLIFIGAEVEAAVQGVAELEDKINPVLEGVKRSIFVLFPS